MAGLLVLFSALVLGVVAVTDVFLKDWFSNLELVRYSERRLFFAATVGLDTVTLQLHAQKLASNASFTLARGRLPRAAKQGLDNHYFLMDHASTESKATLIPIREMVNGALVDNPVNRWTALIDFTSRALLVYGYPTASFNYSDTSVTQSYRDEMRNSLAYVKENGLDVVIPALSLASNQFDERTRSSVDGVELALIASTLAALVPLVLSILLCFGPEIIQSERAVGRSSRWHSPR